MKHSYSAAVLLAVLPALGNAAPWFKRESPTVSITDNAVSTTEAAAVTTSSTEAYATTSAYTSTSETASTQETAEGYGTTAAVPDATSATTDASVTSGTSLLFYISLSQLIVPSIGDHGYRRYPAVCYWKYCHCMWCRQSAHSQGSSDDHHWQERSFGSMSPYHIQSLGSIAD
jgi:hypothetical protein